MNKQEALSILGLGNSANEKDINKKFRTLAKDKHPDKGGDANEFKKISEAYQYLKNPQLEPAFSQPNWAKVQNPFYENVNPFVSTNPFRTGWKVNYVQKSSAAPPTIQTTVDLSFKESVLGCEKIITIDKKNKCDDCNGQGEVSTEEECKPCRGTGKVTQQMNFGIIVGICEACRGRKFAVNKCNPCNGDGSILSESKLNIKIKGGLTNGNLVKLNGAGHYYNIQGHNAKGNILIKVVIPPNPNMHLSGMDLFSLIDISLLEALKGVEKNVSTIDGESILSIKPNARNKDQIIMNKLGVERRGNHIFNINVIYPKNTEKLIELLEEK